MKRRLEDSFVRSRLRTWVTGDGIFKREEARSRAFQLLEARDVHSMQMLLADALENFYDCASCESKRTNVADSKRSLSQINPVRGVFIVRRVVQKNMIASSGCGKTRSPGSHKNREIPRFETMGND